VKFRPSGGLSAGLDIRIVAGPFFIAAKLEAYTGRSERGFF